MTLVDANANDAAGKRLLSTNFSAIDKGFLCDCTVDCPKSAAVGKFLPMKEKKLMYNSSVSFNLAFAHRKSKNIDVWNCN